MALVGLEGHSPSSHCDCISMRTSRRLPETCTSRRTNFQFVRDDGRIANSSYEKRIAVLVFLVRIATLAYNLPGQPHRPGTSRPMKWFLGILLLLLAALL